MRLRELQVSRVILRSVATKNLSGSFSPNPDLLEQSFNLTRRDVVKWPFVFLLQTFSKIFRSHETRLAVGHVAVCPRSELHKSGVRQAYNGGPAIDKKLRIHAIAVAGRDAISKV